ncbi:hypothetical protein HMPREF1244_1445 [Streptococcus pyogenes GA19702]|nr:hypothetical protein HMPREF1236_1895 [Streptococcus pyogenes GA40056]ESU91779.1 hypothetical protein HMPREF1244_1445 [Streptococcus pyogenes GA19702]SDV94769.1 hypothetical protein ISR5_1348 [Streptococcus pyogenes]
MAATSFGILCFIFEPRVSKTPRNVTASIDTTFATAKSSCFGSRHTQK